MRILGLMSGTSADGIDAAICDIDGAPPVVRARVIHAVTVPYLRDFRERILNACQPQTSQVDALCQLNFDLAERFAQAVMHVLHEAGMDAGAVDLIGSHGQTVWHMAQPDGCITATLQLAEASVLAERTGITTVSNFRPRDVAAGGQGAPLTAYADWLLLRHPSRWRAVQNIGGIGNVTFLPPLSTDSALPSAFDTGPGNALIDGAVTLLTGGQQVYDQDGALARHGQADDPWLSALLAHPYYRRQPPKTTGRELFGAPEAARLVAEGQARGLDAASIVATLTALTAASIADAYRRFAPAPIEEVILGGGGRHNPALVEWLRRLLPEAAILNHEDIGIDGDSKEALVFALLAHETWHARPGSLPALTGAAHPVILGQITPGHNYASLLRRTWCA